MVAPGDGEFVVIEAERWPASLACRGKTENGLKRDGAEKFFGFNGWDAGLWRVDHSYLSTALNAFVV